MSMNPSVNPVQHTETHKVETSTQTDKGSIKSPITGRFDQVKETITRGADKVNRGVTTVSRSVSNFASDATKYAQQNPGKALAIAIGSGVGIGYLVGVATRRRNSFWATLSTALVDAITDRIK